MKRSTAICFGVFVLALIGSTGYAQEYTRFLVPVQPRTTPGAFGSVWRTTLAVLYGGAEDSAIFPRVMCGPGTCPFGQYLQPELIPRFFEEFDLSSTGLLLHVPTAQSKDFSFEARVRDESRSLESAGTEIPVVPESRFRDDAVYLLNVPNDSQFRTLLRVYGLPIGGTHSVTIRYYSMVAPEEQETPATVLFTEQVTLSTFKLFDINVRPMYAQLLVDNAALAGVGALWMAITPNDPLLRIWAFTSTTNNDTQEVTLVTPNGG